MTFAREAWPFVAPVVLVSIVLFGLGRWRSAAAVLALALATLLFFRIPSRRFEGDPDVLLSPASGHITAIEDVVDPSLSDEPLTRIVTFLSVFDVHIQRAPADGTVVSSSLRRGKKVAAFRPDAGEVNETQTTIFELASGDQIAVRQIAGLVARRVVSYLQEGDTVARGDLMGVIKFGSRVDLIVPRSFSVAVAKGQRVHEGLTPMAKIHGDSE